MGLQDAVRWLLPKEDHFFELMEKQAATLSRAAAEMARFKPGQTTAEQNAAAIQAIEHEGDALVHAVEESLAKTFVTPIDREDIQKLSSMLDDILDLLNETARSMSLYGLDTPSPPMAQLSELLLGATRQISEALPKLRQANYEALLAASHEVKKLEKEGDKVFRDAVAGLFRDETVSAKHLLRDKEILTDLEEALDSCEDTAEFLAHLAVKNG